MAQKRGDGLERRPPAGTAARQRSEMAYRRWRRSAGTAWSADLRPAPLRDSAARWRIADGAEARGRLGAPTSGRHRCATAQRDGVSPMAQKRGDGLERRPPVGTAARQRSEMAYRRWRRSAGTAWSADLRSAPLRDSAARWRIADGAEARGRLGAPASRHRCATAQRDGVSPMAQKRGDGLERRPPAGIARERETSADDTGPCQRECRTPSQHPMPRPLTAPPTRAAPFSCQAGCK